MTATLKLYHPSLGYTCITSRIASGNSLEKTVWRVRHLHLLNFITNTSKIVDREEALASFPVAASYASIYVSGSLVRIHGHSV